MFVVFFFLLPSFILVITLLSFPSILYTPSTSSETYWPACHLHCPPYPISSPIIVLWTFLSILVIHNYTFFCLFDPLLLCHFIIHLNYYFFCIVFWCTWPWWFSRIYIFYVSHLFFFLSHSLTYFPMTHHPLIVTPITLPLIWLNSSSLLPPPCVAEHLWHPPESLGQSRIHAEHVTSSPDSRKLWGICLLTT